jgi:hypothetical protein
MLEDRPVSENWWKGGRLMAVALACLMSIGGAATGSLEPAFTDVTKSSGAEHLHHKPEYDPKFKKVMPWIASYHAGVAVGDFDGDGYPDLYVVNSRLGQPNALYRNNRNFTFTDVAAEWGVANVNDQACLSMDAAFADFDNDGDQDLFVACYGQHRLFRNDGGHFTDMTAQAGLKIPSNASGVIWLDYDNDGWLDLLIVNYFPQSDLSHITSTKILQDSFFHATNGARPLLYHNNHDGTFTETAAAAGLDYRAWTLDVGAGDINNDGLQDLYIANDYGSDMVFLNTGKGFRDISKTAIGSDESAGMNVEFGDYDGDGLLDIFVTNISNPAIRQGNMLWKNMGNNTFANVARETGVWDTGWGWGGKFLDFDNDGWLDLYTVSGFVSSGPYDLFRGAGSFFNFLRGDISDAAAWPDVRGFSISGYERSHLLKNSGGDFHDVTAKSGLAHVRDGRGIAVADFDLDGGLDIYITNCGQPSILYRNTAGKHSNWIELRLVGTASNRDAIGARVTLTAGGRRQIREVDGGNGYSSQSWRTVHFGLGSQTAADKIEISWPSGTRQVLSGLQSNRLVTVEEPRPYFPRGNR